jgi:hypothetical protein
MNSVKGLVLISRFEYIEINIGKPDLKQFLREISTSTENYTKQPIVGSNNYPENTIAKIDQLLLTKYFKDNVELFRELGEWNANNFMHRFFNLYLDERLPVDFIYQYARLRTYLIGSGEMQVSGIDKNKIKIVVDYGQTIPRSVCLSEQGFLLQGIKLCGADSIEFSEEKCAGLSDSTVCEYQVTFS